MQLFFIGYLPIKVFHFHSVFLNLLRWNEALLTIHIHVTFFGSHDRSFRILNASVGFEQTVLLILADNNVTWVFSDINPRNFIRLVLVNIFERKQTFLAHQRNLLVGPNLGTVVTFFLDFLTELFNGALEVICVILPFLSTFEEKLTLFIKFFLHCLLNIDLLL